MGQKKWRGANFPGVLILLVHNIIRIVAVNKLAHEVHDQPRWPISQYLHTAETFVRGLLGYSKTIFSILQ